MIGGTGSLLQPDRSLESAALGSGLRGPRATGSVGRGMRSFLLFVAACGGSAHPIDTLASGTLAKTAGLSVAVGKF